MYPITLSGYSVTVNGSTAMMQYVSSGQMNFVAPQNMGTGAASVAIHNGAQTQTASTMIRPAGPGYFLSTEWDGKRRDGPQHNVANQ